jgi:Flp pilus assembly protein CpaB
MFRRRWSPKSKALSLLAVACGVASFALFAGYERRLEALRPVVGAQVPVVVAAQDLTRGTVLAADAVRVVRIPSAFAPPGALRSIEQAVGGTLASDLAEGEAVTATRVGTAGGPVASLVPSGLRAFIVPSGMPPGTIRTGDRVDVLATFGGPHPHTETVATGLEVLRLLEVGDAGATLVASGDVAGPSLVLLVSPETAEDLAYATAFAEIAVTIDPTGEAA